MWIDGKVIGGAVGAFIGLVVGVAIACSEPREKDPDEDYADCVKCAFELADEQDGKI